MAIGETLLKITDYPFSYSFAFLLMKATDIAPFSDEAVPYLLVAGIGATFLAIVDPFGKGMKGYMWLFSYINFKRFGSEQKVLENWNEIKGSFNTNSIEVEKDKIVSIIYFLLVMILLMYFILDDDFFSTHFKKFYEDNLDCIELCNQLNTFFGVLIVSLIVSSFGGFRAAYIIDRSRTVATYLKCVNSPHVLNETKDGLSGYIKIGDWETAKKWREKIEDDYINENGLNEQRQKKFSEHISKILTTLYRGISSDKHPTDNEFDIMHQLQNFEFHEKLWFHMFTDKEHRLFYYEFWRYISLEKELDKIRDDLEPTIQSECETLIEKLKAKPGFSSDSASIQNVETTERYHSNSFSESLRKFILEDEINIKKLEHDQLTNIVLSAGGVAILNDKNTEEFVGYLTEIKNRHQQTGVKAQEKIRELVELRILLAKKIERLAMDSEVLGSPLNGFCDSCLNESFRNINFIKQNKSWLKRIDLNLFKYEARNYFDLVNY